MISTPLLVELFLVVLFLGVAAWPAGHRPHITLWFTRRGKP